VSIALSGWTGFAPLTLAKEAGIFKKNGLDVTLRKVPQKDRHLVLASGDVQCAATTVETWIAWNANGVATTQIFQLDKSFGADGMVVKNDITKITDLKGKSQCAWYSTLLYASLDAEEKRHDHQRCQDSEPRAPSCGKCHDCRQCRH
jgi:NitT/TauT family transport system substrate-binding protein